MHKLYIWSLGTKVIPLDSFHYPCFFDLIILMIPAHSCPNFFFFGKPESSKKQAFKKFYVQNWIKDN